MLQRQEIFMRLTSATNHVLYPFHTVCGNLFPEKCLASFGQLVVVYLFFLIAQLNPCKNLHKQQCESVHSKKSTCLPLSLWGEYRPTRQPTFLHRNTSRRKRMSSFTIHFLALISMLSLQTCLLIHFKTKRLFQRSVSCWSFLALCEHSLCINFS